MSIDRDRVEGLRLAAASLLSVPRPLVHRLPSPVVHGLLLLSQEAHVLPQLPALRHGASVFFGHRKRKKKTKKKWDKQKKAQHKV